MISMKRANCDVIVFQEMKECAKRLFLEVLNEMFADVTKEAMDKVGVLVNPRDRIFRSR